MRITVRSLGGDAAELDLEPSTTMAQLKVSIEAAMRIPVANQRLIYAGTQLEDVACPAWRARRGTCELSAALGHAAVLDGTPLTLEQHGLQKGSVVNVVHRATAPAREGAQLQERAPSKRAAAPTGSGEVRGPAAPMPSVGPLVAAAGADVAGAGASTAEGIAAGLEALPDLEVLRLLRPLLRRRPALRAALLADEQSFPALAPSARPGLPLALAQAPLGAPPYRIGDPISVWSNSKQRWYAGEVVNVADGTTGNVPQGSVEVAFQLGRKWIAPADVPRMLGPS
uniref:Ubiquitin-like domain-containing protein n=1 Tax=Pyrodinium bahamense TaxID=73915 RepID=A0A7S0FFH5_9DINO|mmetsp:Transcript_30101/g.83030  ORF Transcript_30101/g.83030 Transcript_30101/m.83030 type:complete len:284 (+) Transcript_30101:70-921(+)